MLDALIKANYKHKGMDPEAVATDDAKLEAAPPAVRAVLAQKKKVDPQFVLRALETPAQRAERSKKMAMQLAEETFGKIVRKKRELWAEHPERHPSGAPTARTRPSSSVRVEAFSMISHLRES